MSAYMVSLCTPGWLARCRVLATRFLAVCPTNWAMLALQIELPQLFRATFLCPGLSSLVRALCCCLHWSSGGGLLGHHLLVSCSCCSCCWQQEHCNPRVMAQSAHHGIQGYVSCWSRLKTAFDILGKQCPQLTVCSHKLFHFDLLKPRGCRMAQGAKKLVHPGVMNFP